jgi:hypothetical protein
MVLPCVLNAVVYFLESFPLLEALSIEDGHIFVALHRNHVKSELADELLPLVLSHILFSQVALYFLQKTIDIQVLQKAAVIQLPQVGILLGKLAHTATTAQNSRNIFEVDHK